MAYLKNKHDRAARTEGASSASDVGLGNVENTALSTWGGSTNITTTGTVSTGSSAPGAGTVILTNNQSNNGAGDAFSFYHYGGNFTGTFSFSTPTFNFSQPVVACQHWEGHMYLNSDHVYMYCEANAANKHNYSSATTTSTGSGESQGAWHTYSHNSAWTGWTTSCNFFCSASTAFVFRCRASLNTNVNGSEMRFTFLPVPVYT